MTVLEDYQFELGGVVFGYGLPVHVDGEGFDPGTDEPETQDVFNGFTESFAFGVDSRQPAVWTWAAHTDFARNAVDAVAASTELNKAWLTAVDPRLPGDVAALRYAFAGRTRVVYGRPRRFYSTKTNTMLYGVIDITAEFARADNLFYDDELQQITMGLQPQQSLGFTTPIVFPLTTLTGAPPLGTTPVIGGDVPAPFIATINGPTSGSVARPKLSTDSWELELDVTIDAGESITINTYPWGMRAVRSDGANISGRFTGKSRLSRARLAVAGETIRFDAIDSSGTATATIAWRRAYSTI